MGDTKVADSSVQSSKRKQVSSFHHSMQSFVVVVVVVCFIPLSSQYPSGRSGNCCCWTKKFVVVSL